MTHSRTPHKDKSDCYFIPAGEAFSPACFVMPFFSCANFAGLFSLQLLTFVCRTPRTLSGGGIIRALTPSSNGLEKRPKLRFPGFDEPWRAAQLGNLLIELSDYATQESGFPLLTSSRQGLFVQEDYFIDKQANAETTVFSVLPYGCITYRHMSDDNIFHFNINRLVANGLVSKEYPVFTVRKEVLDTDFLVDTLNSSPLFSVFCIQQKKGGTRTRLYFKTLCSYQMFLPVLHEQQVIASFIRLLDKRIERQMELVETLKKYKRGVLSVAFGKYGSICSWQTTPYPFAELASRRSEKYDPRSGEQMPCVELEHIEQETGRIIGSIPSTQQNSIKGVCKSGDTLFGKLRPYLRKCAFVKKDMVCSSEIWSLVPSETIIPEYLFYLVQTDEFIKIANISSGTKMPRAEWSNIEKSVFSVPNKEVQAQIVQTLRGLDSRMLDAIDMLGELQLMKEGLLQQLFI